jgi:hypothetical protein
VVEELRAQLAEALADIEARKDAYNELDDANIRLNEWLAEARGVIEATDYSHFHGHKDDLERCSLCSLRNKARAYLEKYK